MVIRILILALGVALLVCGCPKHGGQGKAAEKAGTANAAQNANGEAAAPDTDNFLTAEAQAPTLESLQPQVQKAIQTLGAEHGVSVDLAKDVVASQAHPDKAQKLSEMVANISNQIIQSNEPVSDAYINDCTIKTLDIFVSMAAGTAPAATGGVDSLKAADDQANKITELKKKPFNLNAKLRVPTEIIGNWHSIAEIKGSTVVKHDDTYHDQLVFNDRENGAYSTFREKKLASFQNFKYSFDPKTGRLIINLETSDVWTILLQQPEDNETELRLTKIVEGQTLVFRQD
jgi:hypothetical protein